MAQNEKVKEARDMVLCYASDLPGGVACDEAHEFMERVDRLIAAALESAAPRNTDPSALTNAAILDSVAGLSEHALLEHTPERNRAFRAGAEALRAAAPAVSSEPEIAGYQFMRCDGAPTDEFQRTLQGAESRGRFLNGQYPKFAPYMPRALCVAPAVREAEPTPPMTWEEKVQRACAELTDRFPEEFRSESVYTRNVVGIVAQALAEGQ